MASLLIYDNPISSPPEGVISPAAPRLAEPLQITRPRGKSRRAYDPKRWIATNAGQLHRHRGSVASTWRWRRGWPQGARSLHDEATLFELDRRIGESGLAVIGLRRVRWRTLVGVFAARPIPEFDETRIERRVIDERPAIVYEAIRYTGKRGARRRRSSALCTRRRLLVLAGVSGAVYVLVLRPRLLRWGATTEELRTEYPGADLIAGGKRGATKAITIDAPPAKVWPWLVQMGYGRAGWYSWDRLDNAGVASAQAIHPEWQQIGVGDRLASAERTARASRWRPGTRAIPGSAYPSRPSLPTIRPRRDPAASLRGLAVGLFAQRATSRTNAAGCQWLRGLQPAGLDRNRRLSVLGAGALDNAGPTANQPQTTGGDDGLTAHRRMAGPFRRKSLPNRFRRRSSLSYEDLIW